MIYDSDITYLKKGVYEGHLYVGSLVKFKIIEESELEGIYSEKKKKTYKEVKELHALVISNPSEETIIPQNDETTIVFSFSSLELEKQEVLGLPLETILKSHIEYNSKDYTVLSVAPLNVVRDTMLAYKYECREVQ